MSCGFIPPQCPHVLLVICFGTMFMGCCWKPTLQNSVAYVIMCSDGIPCCWNLGCRPGYTIIWNRSSQRQNHFGDGNINDLGLHLIWQLLAVHANYVIAYLH
eukprot:4673378-Amphidinium_carterae.1